MTQKGTRRNLVLVGLGALAAAATIHAPAAKADQYDFITYLDNNGVPYKNISAMIDLGKDSCSELRRGTDFRNLTVDIVRGGGYSPYEAGIILDGATNYMCPDTLPTVRAQIARAKAEMQSQPVV